MAIADAPESQAEAAVDPGEFRAAEPEPQHLWLKQLIGEWTYTMEMKGGMPQPADGSEPPHFAGTESVHAFGDLWVVGEMMSGDGAHFSRVTLGYDPQKGHYVGTWFSSMMTYLWVYKGELDEAQRVLTLSSEGPSFTDPTVLASYQDVITIHDDDYRTMTARHQDENGEWQEMMVMHYRRVK
ncbi:MAG: DUF1579 domain-containing protein [Chloroflexota bacterium]